MSSIGQRVDGSPRLRFRFTVTMADRDLCLVTSLRDFIGTGSLVRQPPQKPGWQPTVHYSVGGRRAIRERVIDFCDRHLVAGAKRTQYLRWRDEFHEYEAHFPSRWGAGRSPCTVDGCSKPVRGRGLCRAHYYEATGY